MSLAGFALGLYLSKRTHHTLGHGKNLNHCACTKAAVVGKEIQTECVSLSTHKHKGALRTTLSLKTRKIVASRNAAQEVC